MAVPLIMKRASGLANRSPLKGQDVRLRRQGHNKRVILRNSLVMKKDRIISFVLFAFCGEAAVQNSDIRMVKLFQRVVIFRKASPRLNEGFFLIRQH